MNPIQKLALLFLSAIVFFSWGTAMVAFKVFPYPVLQPAIEEMQAWYGGVDEGKPLTFREKIGNDFFGTDLRYMAQTTTQKKLNLELTEVTDPKGLMDESSQTMNYLSEVEDGYYVFYTLLNLPDAKFGAVVVSAQGEIEEVIKLPGENRHGQGEVTEDGNLVFVGDGELTVTDVCGNYLYEQYEPGDRFHHRASGYDGSLWAWNEDAVQQIDINSGEVLTDFSLLDLIGANEQLPVLEARLIKKNIDGKTAEWKYSLLRDKAGISLEEISLEDPFHHNDVDVLTPKMAPLFPMFDVGDVLLSFRSINLVVVVDPGTLKIKWYVYGEFSRQHDPDWGPNGEIIIYDNWSHSTQSRILSINVDTKKPTVLVDGDPLGFYQFAGGNQHMHSDGKVLFNNGGEAVQVDGNNRVVFYFQNRKDNKSRQAAKISTVRYITGAEFSDWKSRCRQ